MSKSDEAHLEDLRLARDALTAALIEGRSTVEYTIRGRKHRVEASSEALERIKAMIREDEVVVDAASASGSRFTLASLSRPA